MKCSVEGCPNEAWARSWCRKHYMRWHSHGCISIVTQKVAP